MCGGDTHRKSKDTKGRQRYICKCCEFRFVPDVQNNRIQKIISFYNNNGFSDTKDKFNLTPERLGFIVDNNNLMSFRQPKILLLDIETLPIVAYTWGLYKQNLSYENIIKDWCCLSWSAKWLFDDDVLGGVLTSEEAKSRDDSRIIKNVWKLIDQSDVIIAHNCKKFDIKRLNTRFKLNGLKPPMPYQQIDTLEVARKYFSFSSNRLDYIGKIMARDEKLFTDFNLWKKCDQGDYKSLSYMLNYNKKDVLLLEEVYVELRPWIKSHPNMGIYCESKDSVCGNCGSHKLKWGGAYVTPSGRFSAYRCDNCGAIGRSRKSDLNKIEKQNLTISVAR